MSEDFGRFYEGTRHRVLRAVYVCIRDLDEADDAVSEAYTRAYARWDAVRAHPNPVAWVTRTALNYQRSRLRRRRHERRIASGHELGYLPEDPIDSALVEAILAMPERQRQVIGLRILLDLDTAATAEVLDVAPGTVTAHLHRALTSLREQITEEAYADGS